MNSGWKATGLPRNMNDNKNEVLKFRQRRIIKLEKEADVQKKIAEAIKVSETRYRRLFETAKDGILILNAKTGKIVDVNPFLIDLLGHSRKEFLGKKLWEIGPFKDIEVSKTAFQALQKRSISVMSIYRLSQRMEGV